MSAHRLLPAQLDHVRLPGERWDAHHPIHQRGTPGEPCAHGLGVELEPSRPARRGCLGVDGDDLEVAVGTEGEDAVVRAEGHVAPTGVHGHAEALLDPPGAFGEVGGRYDKMVELAHDRQHRP